MNATRMNLLGLLPLLVMLGISAFLYPSLPEQIPSISSNPDDTQPKLLMAVLLPGIYLVVFACINFMVNHAPKKFSMPNSRRAVGTLFFGSGVMFCFAHFASLNHHGDFNFFVNYFSWGMAVFLIIAGNVMGKTERNFVFGVYLPWTLASEANWRASHRVVGRLMVVAGIVLGIANIWITNLGLAITAIVAPFILMAIYSYRYYVNYEKESEHADL